MSRKDNLILVQPGTKMPFLSEDIRNCVKFEVILDPTDILKTVKFPEKFDLSDWEAWRVTGGKAGFADQGSIKIQCYRLGITEIWITTTRSVFGIVDSGIFRPNFRFCLECGKICGYQKISKLVGNKNIVTYRCSNCGNEWTVEPSNARKKCRKNLANRKPKFKNNGKRRLALCYQRA